MAFGVIYWPAIAEGNRRLLGAGAATKPGQSADWAAALVTTEPKALLLLFHFLLHSLFSSPWEQSYMLKYNNNNKERNKNHVPSLPVKPLTVLGPCFQLFPR